MKKQDFFSHVRYYVPHHFVFYPVVLFLFILSVIFITTYPELDREWKMFAAVIAVVGWLSYMMRQHYALTLQNRVVRLEMRLRYYQLTGQRLEPLEAQLRFRQLAALRFAADDELPMLVQKTIAENLSPSEIKKSITNWMPDHMRV